MQWQSWKRKIVLIEIGSPSSPVEAITLALSLWEPSYISGRWIGMNGMATAISVFAPSIWQEIREMPYLTPSAITACHFKQFSPLPSRTPNTLFTAAFPCQNCHPPASFYLSNPALSPDFFLFKNSLLHKFMRNGRGETREADKKEREEA